MGHGTRDQLDKVFISASHEKLKPQRSGPGPIYDVPTDVGKSFKYSFGCAPQRVLMKQQFPDSSVDLIEHIVDSQYAKYENTRGFYFGTEAKDSMKNATILRHHPQAAFGVGSPGPAAYFPDDRSIYEKPEEYPLGMKTQILGSKCQTPQNVGPNSYPPAEAVGKQALSQRRTLSSWSFSKSKRFPSSAPDLTILDPNPPLNSIGKQVKSRSKTAEKYGFGTATRAAMSKTGVFITDLDKGPAATPTSEMNLPHPKLQMEKKVVKYSPMGLHYQGMN